MFKVINVNVTVKFHPCTNITGEKLQWVILGVIILIGLASLSQRGI